MSKIEEITPSLQVSTVHDDLVLRIIEDNATLKTIVEFRKFVLSLDWKALHNALVASIQYSEKQIRNWRSEFEDGKNAIEKFRDDPDRQYIIEERDKENKEILELIYKEQKRIDQNHALQQVCSAVIQVKEL